MERLTFKITHSTINLTNIKGDFNMKKTLTETQNKAVQNYPTDYYNTSASSQIHEEVTKSLIESAISTLNKNPESNGYGFWCYLLGYEEDGGGIHIIVSQNYEEIYIDNAVHSK